MHVTYPKEALRVEYKNHTYIIDMEGYLLCSRVSALYSISILEQNSPQDLRNIPWVSFKEVIFYMETEDLYTLPCDHRRFHNCRQESLLEKLLEVILANTLETSADPEPESWEEITGFCTLWDRKSRISFKSTHQQKFPDGSCIFLLTRDEDLGDNGSDAPNNNL